jgi:hypothetical protein
MGFISVSDLSVLRELIPALLIIMLFKFISTDIIFYFITEPDKNGLLVRAYSYTPVLNKGHIYNNIPSLRRLAEKRVACSTNFYT